MSLSAMYRISRVFIVFCPWFLLIFVWRNALWSEVLWVQWFVVALYALLSVPAMAFGYNEIRIAYCLRHILPEQDIPSMMDADCAALLRRIEITVRELKEIPQREAIVDELFGCDIGCVINQFVSR